MSDTEQADSTIGPINSPLFLDVNFSFDRHWAIGPDGRLSKFPPGIGSGGKTIEIGPVKLDGLSAAQIAVIVAQRTADMGVVATAMAVATRQLAAALEAAGSGS